MSGIAVFANTDIKICLFGDVEVGFVYAEIAIHTIEVIVITRSGGTGLTLDSAVPS